MMVRRGMKMAEVLKVRADMVKVDEEVYGGVLVEEYEGVADDGSVLCVEVEDGVVVEVVKAMYV